MVRPAAGARPLAGRGRRPATAAVLRSSRCGGRSAIRSRPSRSRSPTPGRCREKNLVISERRYPGSHRDKPIEITYNPDHAWYWYPAHAARRGAGVQNLIARQTAGRAGPRIPRSTTPPHRPVHGHAKASKSGRSRFFSVSLRFWEVVKGRRSRQSSRDFVGWVEPKAKPAIGLFTTCEAVMGLAALDPSYGLRAPPPDRNACGRHSAGRLRRGSSPARNVQASLVHRASASA